MKQENDSESASFYYSFDENGERSIMIDYKYWKRLGSSIYKSLNYNLYQHIFQIYTILLLINNLFICPGSMLLEIFIILTLGVIITEFIAPSFAKTPKFKHISFRMFAVTFWALYFIAQTGRI